jgi:hypothetical protein
MRSTTWRKLETQGMRTVSYVNLNHEVLRQRYEFSSHDFYVGRRQSEWLDVKSGLWFFGGVDQYSEYIVGKGTADLEAKIARRARQPKTRRRPIRRGRPSHIANPES